MLWLIQNKYISKDCEPIKCSCGCKKLKDENYDYMEAWGSMVVCEYDAVCKSCGNILGHWAHGSWDMIDILI